MLNELKKYPIIIIFFVFLLGFAICDSAWPKREFSELENRELAQYPQIKVQDVLSNKWMVNYEKYVKDQFILRDEWINVKSRCEDLLLKTENNDVWFGKGGAMFQKLLAINETQFNKNVGYVNTFSANINVPITAIIAPSASLVWQEKLPYATPVVNEGAYLDSMFKSFEKSAINTVDVRTKFSNHKAEPLYYLTDHHWTTHGAYLAYEEFAQNKGLTPFDLSKASLKTQDGFYGTNFSKARKSGTNAEIIEWYDIKNTLTVYKSDGFSDGVEGSIYNTEKWASRDKYGAFLRGNNGYSILDGNGNGSVLVIKDSYANSFIPFLTANYEKIGIIDLRATNLVLDELIKNEGYDEVLILYNFQTFTNENLFKLALKTAK